MDFQTPNPAAKAPLFSRLASEKSTEITSIIPPTGASESKDTITVTPDNTPKRRSRKASTFKFKHGERSMKLYALTAGELWQLFAFGLLATTLFSISVWLFGSSFEIYKDLAFNAGLAPDVVTHWKGLEDKFFDFAIIAFIGSIIFAIFESAKIIEIINTTKFDEE